MRTGIFLFAGIAGLGLSLGLSAVRATAQSTSAAPTPATTPPASVPAPVQDGTTPAAIPAPVPEGQDKIESRPGYANDPAANPQTMPVPSKAPQPVVTTASPTQQTPYTALPPYGSAKEPADSLGSAYIPVDSWVYPAMMRLYSMGYLDTMYLSMRPYTRRSALHMLQASEDAILSSDDEQAQEILAALLNELTDEGITDKIAASAARSMECNRYIPG